MEIDRLVVNAQEFVFRDPTKLMSPETHGEPGQILCYTSDGPTWTTFPSVHDLMGIPFTEVRNNGNILLFNIRQNTDAYFNSFYISVGGNLISVPLYSEYGIRSVEHVLYQGDLHIKLIIGSKMPAWTTGRAYFNHTTKVLDVTYLNAFIDNTHTIYYGLIPNDRLTTIHAVTAELFNAVRPTLFTKVVDDNDSITPISIDYVSGSWFLAFVPTGYVLYKYGVNQGMYPFNTYQQSSLESNGGISFTYNQVTYRVYGEFCSHGANVVLKEVKI